MAREGVDARVLRSTCCESRGVPAKSEPTAACSRENTRPRAAYHRASNLVEFAWPDPCPVHALQPITGIEVKSSVDPDLELQGGPP